METERSTMRGLLFHLPLSTPPLSHASLLTGTAAIVGKGCHIFDGFDLQTGRFQCGDGAFSTAPRPLDSNFQVLDAKLLGLFGHLLRGTLSGKRRTLSASLEATGTRTGPAQGIALVIGDRDRCVIKRCLDVGDSHRNVATCFAPFCFCHPRDPPLSPVRTYSVRTYYRISFTPRLPATVFFGPLRVRALVRVLWPRTGNPLRCRSPR